jgi:tetratricopeptide (TPR) repeat protein
VALYREGAEASARAGDLANAAFGDCNVGEVLSDQGRLDDAEALLLRARRIWRGTGYAWGVGYATAGLGRTAVRAGRLEEGRGLLSDALAAFRALHVEGDAALVEALLCEADAFAGRPGQALEAAEALLAGLPDGGRPAALLHRVRGYCLAQLGDGAAARDALEASVAEARAQGELYEIAASLDALHALAGDAFAERDELLARLDVRDLPPAPLATGGTPDPARPPAPPQR